MSERKILVIDDEPDILEILIIELRNRGYQVEAADDAGAAFEKAHDFLPDIIISDIAMPEMNGFELITEFRKHRKFENIPFIVISGYSDDQKKMSAEKSGADGYLEKPINFNHLAAKIENLLRKRRFKFDDSRVLFSGKIKEMSVLETAQLFNQNNKTGRLIINNTMGGWGEMIYDSGNIVYCAFPPYFSIVAFHHMIRINEGEFTLVENNEKPLKNIWIDSNNLIMQAATHLDEFDIDDIENQLFLPVKNKFWIQGRKYLSELTGGFSNLTDAVIFEKSGRVLISLRSDFQRSVECATLYLNLCRVHQEHDASALNSFFLIKTNKIYIIYFHLCANFIISVELYSDAQIGVILNKLKKELPKLIQLLN